MPNFNILRESVGMALSNIRGNKMRSFLTMLGIVIGVSSVIGLITIVQSVTNSVMGEFSSLGANTLTVNAVGTAIKNGLSESDLDKIRNVEGVSAISPSVSMTAKAVYDDEIFDHVSVDGTDAIYFQHSGTSLQSGRLFNAAETQGDVNVCIVDKDFVKNVLKGNASLGTSFILNGFTYRIIGIKSDDESLMTAMADNSDLDGTVTVPYKNVLKMTSVSNVNALAVYIQDGYDTNAAEASLRKVLDSIYNDADNSYSIFNMESLTAVMGSINGTLSAMLGGIASISLLVGGIGIMNMMLVSVTERTREIGLRKAMGAEPRRIQSQFLIESVTLSLFGGLIGILLGILLAVAASAALKTDFAISWSAILLGAGFSAAVGIIFGWMPARRASRLNPIDALRSE